MRRHQIPHPLPTLLAVILAASLPESAFAQSVGELILNAGVAQGIRSDGKPTSLAFNGSFALVASRFSFGPELQYSGGEKRILAYGAVARLRLRGGAVRPYLVGSLGGYSWRENQFTNTNLLSGSLGAGLMLGGGAANPRWTVEARYHDNLQNIAAPGQSWRFVTVTGGVRFGW